MLQVLQAAFGRWPKTDISVAAIDHLQWKRESDPEAEAYHCVAELEGRIVGVQLYIVQDVTVRGDVLRIAQGADFCVHPDYRGRGVRRAMYEHSFTTVEVGTPLILTIDSDHPAMRHINYVEPRKRVTFANKIHVLECDDAPMPGGLSNSGMRIRRVSEFDERTDAFCVEASGVFDLIVRRSQTYLNWRYADERAGTFLIYVADEGSNLIGYAVAGTAQGRACIADVLVLPGRSDVAAALLQRTVRDFRENGIGKVACWTMTHHPYQLALSTAGFNTKRRSLALLTRPRGDRPNSVTFADDPRAIVHIMAGDTDLV